MRCSEERPKAKVLWSGVLHKDTIRLGGQSVRLMPTGDIRLRRFRKTHIVFDSLYARTNWQFTVANLSGDPFKKVEWICGDTTISKDMAATWEQKGVTRKNCTPELIIKPALALKRSVAFVDARYSDTVRTAISYTVQETLTDLNQYAGVDTLWRFWKVTQPYSRSLLLENRSEAVGVGKYLHGKRQLSVRVYPNKPERLLPNKPRKLSRTKKTSIRYDAFQPGDTLVFSVEAMGEPLQKVELTHTRGKYLHIQREVKTFADTVVAGDEKYWELNLCGKFGWKKQMANIAVWRIHPARLDTICQNWDTLYALDYKIVYDTVAVMIKNDSLRLAPVLDMENSPLGYFDVEVPDTLPQGLRLLFVAYWGGINRPCLAAYQDLESTVPKTWSRPGVPPALCAYGMGYPLSLPQVRVSDVDMTFITSPSDPSKGLWEITFRKNAGHLTLKQLRDSLNQGNQSGYYHFWVVFKNKNTVNDYPIQLKMIAFYQKEKLKQLERKLLETKMY